MNSFSQQITTARKAKNWAQRDLALAAGIGFASISRYEAGLSYPRPAQMRRLCEALGISVVKLVTSPDIKAVSIDSQLYEMLTHAAINSGRDVYDEINERLRSTFGNDAPLTMQVLEKRLIAIEKRLAELEGN